MHFSQVPRDLQALLISTVIWWRWIYEGNSICKLQIVIEKNRMEIMTYKQHLFFNIISIQIWTLVPPFHKSLETCSVKFFWLLSEPRAHCSFKRLDVRLRYLSALPRTSAPNYGLPDVTGNVHRTWAAFLCGYPLLPYFLPTKNERHAVLSWYTYSGAPPSCNSCYVCTVMRIPIVVHHNKTR